MRKYLFLCMTLCGCFYLQAQLTVNYSSGYSTYDTDGMRELLRNIQTSHPISAIGAKNLGNFQAHNIIHVVDIGYLFDKHEFGIKGGGYHSTGGKLSIKDYSGEYSNLFIVNGLRAGLYYRNYFYTFWKNTKPLFSFYGELSPGIFLSDFKNNSFLIINDEVLDSTDVISKMNSLSLLAQVGAKFNVYEKFHIHTALGYEIADKTNDDDSVDHTAYVNWSGIRFSVGVGITF